MLTRIYQSRLSPLFLIVIRFIKFNLTSRAYQTKSSPLEGLARPRALPRPPPYRWRIIVRPQTARQSTHVRAGAAAIHLSAHLSCPVSRSVARAQPRLVIRFIKFNLTSRAYQTKSSPLEGLARPRALPRPPPYGAVERSARAWSPALQAGELDEMTNWLRIAYTPQVIYPTPMDQREMDKWAEWCDSTPWGTHSPAPTPTPCITIKTHPAVLPHRHPE
jgi:hypothetical protein